MSGSTDRATICSYYIKSLRLGELSAAQQLEPYIAEEAVAKFGDTVFKGRETVLEWVTGRWPIYAQWPRAGVDIMNKAGWSDAVEEGDHFVVVAEYPKYVPPRKVITKVLIRFNDRDEISEVEHELTTLGHPTIETNTIPLEVRGLVNDALNSGKPMLTAYVSSDNKPVMSFRGSIQFFGPTQISAWLRHAEGDMAKSLELNPAIALTYFDSPRLVSLYIQGRGHITEDEDIKRKVFDMLPEIEQKHDPERLGACLIVDIDSVRGNLSDGAVVVNL